MSLKEKVMIVNLTISQWSARKYDAKASKEVEAAHNAREAGRFNKSLLQSDTLKEIGKVANQMRTLHYEKTLPWGDNGDRVLSTEIYFEYITQVGQLTLAFNQAAEQFVSEYTNLKEDAKLRLNTLYREDDYLLNGKYVTNLKHTLDLCLLQRVMICVLICQRMY